MNPYIVAGTLIAAVAGIYVFWGPSQKPKKRQKVPGLTNLGNSCFLNAVVQALSACPVFIRWLQMVVDKLEQRISSHLSLSSALLTLLKDLNSDEVTCNAQEVVHALQMKGWVISNEEQDAHELLNVLTTTLEEEISAITPVFSLLEVSKLQTSGKDIDRRMCKPFVAASCCAPKNALPYRGLLSNQLICRRCDYKYPVKYDSFDSISLSLPTFHVGPLKLQDCLSKFVSCEQIVDVKCELCCKNETSSSEQKSVFIKQLSFGKLPECLCFHIQRTTWLDNGVPAKRFDHVQFPEILYMDNFMHKPSLLRGTKDPKTDLVGGSAKLTANTSESRLKQKLIHDSMKNETGTVMTCKSFHCSVHAYVLQAVVVHVGDLCAGHFVTYRRGPCNTPLEKRWFCTSDSSTDEVTFSEVAKVPAYMLFYEKLIPDDAKHKS